MAKSYGYLQNRSLEDVCRRTNMYFVAGDFSFDYLLPTMPNLVLIGGINSGPAKPLEASLETFMQSSKEKGVVIISFGSLVKTMDEEVINSIAEVTRALPYFFVWKLIADKQPNLGKNVKILEWLPQNDLLGHEKTVAFVSHGGNNGLWEAVNHGVPTVVLSMGGDGPSNGVKLTERGMGLWMDLKDCSSEDLKYMISEVVEKKKYKENAKHVSLLYHSNDMTVSERIVFWTNYLLKTKGAEHLIPASVELNFFQYYLIDVIAFLTLLVLVAVFVSIFTIKRLFDMCRRLCSGSKFKRE